LCASEVENNINRSYDGEPVEGCPDDLFMVHLTGFITIPEHTTIEFWLASDDGGEATIGGNTWGSWTDQGCSAWQSGNLSLQAGSLPLEVWMYENGGGTCLMLAWKIDDGDWEIVPDEAFSTSPVATTTTDVSTTTVAESTTSSLPQTTSTESTTTTTQPPPVPTPVTQPQTVEPEPVDTVAPEEPEITETGTTTTLVEEATPEEMLPEETTTTDEPSPEPSPDTTDELIVDTTFPDVDTILPEEPETPLEAPLSDEEVDSLIAEAETTEALVEALAELSPEQVEQVVESLLAEEPSEEQATALASSPEVLAVVTAEQAQQIFEVLDVGALSDTQTEELIAAIESAPTEIREEFEDTIDIFGEGLDDYTPTGSTIPVGERRTLIAVTAGITLAAAGTRIRR
jgi:hypothetical protein